MYEIIDESLKINACNISDLTLKQVQQFLGCWNDSSSISKLTLFAENDGTIVLNKDSRDYDFYRKLAKSYISSTLERRKEIKARCDIALEETFAVMDAALRQRRTMREMEILGRHKMPDAEYVEMIDCIIKKRGAGVLGAIQVFTYGFMQGKRVERARKKRMV